MHHGWPAVKMWSSSDRGWCHTLPTRAKGNSYWMVAELSTMTVYRKLQKGLFYSKRFAALKTPQVCSRTRKKNLVSLLRGVNFAWVKQILGVGSQVTNGRGHAQHVWNEQCNVYLHTDVIKMKSHTFIPAANTKAFRLQTFPVNNLIWGSETHKWHHSWFMGASWPLSCSELLSQFPLSIRGMLVMYCLC